MAPEGSYVHMFALINKWKKRLDWLEQSPVMTSKGDVAQIINVVQKVTGVTEAELLSRRQQKDYVVARHIAIQLMIEMTDLSFNQIATAMNRDHTTILYVKKKMENRGRGR